MLFNSGIFLQFFAAVLLLYYCLRNNLAARNVLLIIASYVFYGWWDYRFLALLIASSVLDYGVGLGLGRLSDARQRKWLVALSIAGNLSILGFFKYYDFFARSLAEGLAQLGWQAPLHTLGIVLPVGISFYTFQTMSYALDVYRNDIKPTRNLIEFLAYVSFFPQLVAGPIERGAHLLPQFGAPRQITLAMVEEGIWLGLWGMFKKVVLADSLAPLVELVYDQAHPGAWLTMLGTIAFGLQIYCDFSGYSDIARGTARLMGFDIMLNFNLPYLATNPREFWRRWHISLSTWLRDYLYISLGGNRRGTWRTYRNLFLTMLLGGLWHGAAWNFILWGVWHGAGLALHRLWESARPRSAPSAGGRVLAWGATMAFVFYGWLLFRAGSWPQIVDLTISLGDFRSKAWSGSYLVNLVLFALPLVAMQTWQALKKDVLAPLQLSRGQRGALEGLLLIGIVLFWEKEKVPFIYFQF